MALTKVQDGGINLADTFAFTGTCCLMQQYQVKNMNIIRTILLTDSILVYVELLYYIRHYTDFIPLNKQQTVCLTYAARIRHLQLQPSKYQRRLQI